MDEINERALYEKVHEVNLSLDTIEKVLLHMVDHGTVIDQRLLDELSYNREVFASSARKCGLCTDEKPCNFAACPDDIAEQNNEP